MAKSQITAASIKAAKSAPSLGAAILAAAAPAAKKPGAAKHAASAALTWSSKAPAVKRGAAAIRYAAYHGAVTVAAYLAAGGTRADLAWDSAPSRGFITIA